MKEWEFHQARLHHKGSAKFTALTPREASAPFDRGHDVADLLILICSTVGIVVIVLLLAVGLI
jgi:hypothetical protein